MPFITVPVDGGLDLLSAPVSVQPGRLQDGSNFEVAIRQGIKSSDGFERFDGGLSPSSSSFSGWIVPVSGNVNAIDLLVDLSFLGGTVAFNVYNERTGEALVLTCSIFFTEGATSTTGFIYFTTTSAKDAELLASINTSSGWIFQDSTVSCTSADFIFFEMIARTGDVTVAPALATVQAVLDAKELAYAATRGVVQEVPGQDNILGLFWLKDELYAARDYLTLAYDTPLTTPAYDDELFIGATYGTATWTGFLAKQVSTSATADVVSGLMMFYDTTGTPTLATIKNHSDSDAAVATITSLDTSAQAAGLYRADGTRGSTIADQSWTHQNLGANIRYKDGQIAFITANRLAPTTPQADLIQETDWVVAANRQTFGDGSTLWNAVGGTGPEFVDCLDGSLAAATNYWAKSFSANGNSSYFWINEFGLTDADVPAGSAITGFTVSIQRRVQLTGVPGGGIYDGWLKLSFASDSGVAGDANFANGALAWGAVDAVVTYGGAQSLLGYSGISSEDVKSTDFGLQLAVGCVGYSGAGSFDARVSEVKIKVHYIPPQAKIYFWNSTDPAPSAVTAEVVQSYQTSGVLGDVGVTNAKGTLYLMNVGTNRAVGGGEMIRTYPADPATPPDGGAADGSVLIATSDTAMAKNVMDWGALLQKRSSKYQYDTHNFYAASDFEAIYGVSGAGYGFMYDDYAFCRILTGTPEAYDIPRHVIAHQQRLFYGYGSGQYMWGEPGEPLLFEAAEGTSAEDGVGSSIRGFMQMNGDTLAIFNQKGVAMIQGDVGLDPYPGTITSDVGCVEYSGQSMGNYMYMSFRGAQNLRSTPSYGDFDNSQFSWDVWDWLRPRVQTSAFFESANIGLINSYPVRNKSQCRWVFADGAQLTATFLREGESPQFTIQNYTNASGDPLTWDVLTAGVESNGRDRIFGATNDGTGYVYEIDRGYSFDGANIAAYATLVVMDQQAPEQRKQFTDMQVHGKATDYASFTTSRAVNYGEPDPDKNYPNKFGSLTAVPTGQERYFSSAIPVRIEGRNIILRFDRDNNNEPPVTIQAISYNILPAGDKQT